MHPFTFLRLIHINPSPNNSRSAMRSSLLALVLSIVTGCGFAPNIDCTLPGASCPGQADTTGDGCGCDNPCDEVDPCEDPCTDPCGDDDTDPSNTANFCGPITASTTAACTANGGTLVGTCLEEYDLYTFVCYTASGSTTTTSEDNDTTNNYYGESDGVTYECNNGIDDDGDGLIDFGTGEDNDPGCASTNDDDESNSSGGGGGVDVLGAYYCDSSWNPANDVTSISEVTEQDTDFDGSTDQVWISGVLEYDELWILDLDSDNVIDSGWGCVSSPDGTDDDTDDDGDGFSETDGDWDDRAYGNKPGTDEVCGDGMDNDCDGAMDEICQEDLDRDGYSPLQGDCNDDASTLHPYADEMSNGVDDDCDGTIDDPSSVDSDGDGYCESGVDNNGDEDCFDSGESSTTSYDCDEGNADVHPGATDWGDDGVDNDCDGVTDEG